MSTATTSAAPAGAAAADATSGTVPPGGPPWRRWRGPALWTLLVLVIAGVLTLIALGQQRSTMAMDPGSVERDGAHALVEVLRDHGVDVDVVRSQQALLDADVGAGTTVLVTRTSALSARTAGEGRRASAGADRVVLLEPGRAAIRGFELPVENGPSTYQPATAHCSTGDVRRDDRISGTRTTYLPHDGVDAEVCFPGPETDQGERGGTVVTLPATADRPQAVLLGSSDLLTNGTVTDADHAGVAVRTLGHSERLVWYVATVDDITAEDPTAVSNIVPAWLTPALLLLGSAVVVLILWRGRRLGRLVTEPLPVVVRATETTESRGRLYRRARDRSRAVAVLQAGARRRLAARLGLPSGTRPEDLASAVAGATGRHTDEVARLLGRPDPPPAVADDATMLDLAGKLARLEEEVRRR